MFIVFCDIRQPLNSKGIATTLGLLERGRGGVCDVINSCLSYLLAHSFVCASFFVFTMVCLRLATH